MVMSEGRLEAGVHGEMGFVTLFLTPYPIWRER